MGIGAIIEIVIGVLRLLTAAAPIARDLSVGLVTFFRDIQDKNTGKDPMQVYTEAFDTMKRAIIDVATLVFVTDDPVLNKLRRRSEVFERARVSMEAIGNVLTKPQYQKVFGDAYLAAVDIVHAVERANPNEPKPVPILKPEVPS